MELPSAKQLAALAKACRKCGITSFKGAGIEFTLSPEAPVKIVNKPSRATAPADLGENVIETDELGPEALMFWSTSDVQLEGGEQ